MEIGYNFGTYVVSKQILSEKLASHFLEATQFRRNIGLGFLDLDQLFFGNVNSRFRNLIYLFLELIIELPISELS